MLEMHNFLSWKAKISTDRQHQHGRNIWRMGKAFTDHSGELALSVVFVVCVFQDVWPPQWVRNEYRRLVVSNPGLDRSLSSPPDAGWSGRNHVMWRNKTQRQSGKHSGTSLLEIGILVIQDIPPFCISRTLEQTFQLVYLVRHWGLSSINVHIRTSISGKGHIEPKSIGEVFLLRMTNTVIQKPRLQVTGSISSQRIVQLSHLGEGGAVGLQQLVDRVQVPVAGGVLLVVPRDEPGVLVHVVGGLQPGHDLL